MTNGFSMHSFVFGTMLGVLLAGVWFSHDDISFLSHPFSATMENAKRSSSESGAISVTNQPAGSLVTVESVTVPPPGVWVAVREVQGDDLGNVLGAVRVMGPRSNVSVPLLRATLPDFPYAVELYRADNEGAFDPASESVYVDFSTNAPVIARFVATK